MSQHIVFGESRTGDPSIPSLITLYHRVTVNLIFTTNACSCARWKRLSNSCENQKGDVLYQIWIILYFTLGQHS